MKKLGLFALLGLAFAFSSVEAAKAQNTRVYTSCAAAAWSNLDLGRPLQLLPDGRLCVNATVSASINGFTPNGNYATLVATAATSASTTLPAGTDVAFENTSTIDVSCVLTAGASTATTNKIIVRGGATVFLTVGTATTAACINQTGSASNTIVMVGGAGLGTNFGGGGGGGGGGAITAASGSFASGAISSGAYASGAFASGAFASGSVASGAFASGSLASGSMVDLLTIIGSKGAGTAAASSFLSGGVYNSTPPSLTTGQQASLQLDSAGNLKVTGATGGGAVTVADGVDVTQGAIADAAVTAGASGTVSAKLRAISRDIGTLTTLYNANGRTTSANSSPVVTSPSPTTYTLVSLATTNPVSVKASAATVMSCQLGNTGSTVAYLKIFNKASAPTVGTDTPVKNIIIPKAGTAADGAGNTISFGPGGFTLGTGFAIAVTAGVALLNNTAVAADAVTVNCDYE